MKYILSLIILLMLPALAIGQTVTFAWDYEVIEEAKITGFHLWRTKTPGSYIGASVQTYAPSLRTGTDIVNAYGKNCYSLTAYYADPTETTESPYSNEVCTVLKPKPPRLISAVQTALMAPFNGAKWLFAKLIGKSKNLKILS